MLNEIPARPPGEFGVRKDLKGFIATATLVIPFLETATSPRVQEHAQEDGWA
jgi:hypothetical protein